MGADTETQAWHGRLTRLPVTASLVVICVVGFVATLSHCASQSESAGSVVGRALWSLGSCRDSLVRFGALDLGRLWVDGAWSRVLWTGLLHGSVLHVALNMWSLFAVGEWAERVWGSGRFALLFAASSIGGCLASAAWAEAPMVVGASAGVFGIAGALLVGRLVGEGRIGDALAPISVRMLGGCLLALILIGAWVPVIAQAGHLGGLAVGALLGLGWSRRGVWVVVGWGGAMTVVGGLVLLAAGPPRFGLRDALIGYRLLELGRHDAAAEAFTAALADAPDDPDLANAVAYALAEADVELTRARELVGRALESEPENPDYLDTLGWIECRRGETEAGREALERAKAVADFPIPEVEEHLVRCAAEANAKP